MRASFSALLLVTACATSAAKAAHTVVFSGEARSGSRLVYTEQHEVQVDDNGRILGARTRYLSASGRAIAELESNFRESLTVPEHRITDYRTGNVQGLRREKGRLVLFDRDPGEPERTRIISESDGAGRILVACQGLNYYLLGNPVAFDRSGQLPLRFLIPGKLDYFDFTLEKVRETEDGRVDYEIAIQNWFLRLFAPKLYVTYDRVAKRIVKYRGLSNITDENGQPQNVTIDYTYRS